MRREIWRQFDYWLFGSVVLLCIFGIVMIRSAIGGSPGLEGYPRRQTIFVLISLGIILAMTLIDYHIFAALSRPMYIFAVVSLIVIFVVGAVSFGSARWIKTGLVDIQPSELSKSIMIVVLSNYFAKHKDDPHDLQWMAKSLLLTGGVVIWILLQPNLSTSIVVVVIWFSLIWISGLPPKYLILFAIGGIILGLAAFPFLEEYQQLRILNFIFPDPNARHGNSYNVEQALITIGSGGLFGQGYGSGTQVQLRYLKVRHTDFIFSAMAEELGFIGTILVISVLIFVILRCYRASKIASDAFGSYIAFGSATLLFFQTIVNIGVNLNVIPVTGLTLPFISYGGSSIVSLAIIVGFVESVVSHHKPLDF